MTCGKLIAPLYPFSFPPPDSLLPLWLTFAQPRKSSGHPLGQPSLCPSFAYVLLSLTHTFSLCSLLFLYPSRPLFLYLCTRHDPRLITQHALAKDSYRVLITLGLAWRPPNHDAKSLVWARRGRWVTAADHHPLMSLMTRHGPNKLISTSSSKWYAPFPKKVPEFVQK